MFAPFPAFLLMFPVRAGNMKDSVMKFARPLADGEDFLEAQTSVV